jgi:hypothetical protein
LTGLRGDATLLALAGTHYNNNTNDQEQAEHHNNSDGAQSLLA